MAITIDTGTEANVHPSDKQTVGERLAKWALVRIYGQDGIESGPIPISEVVKRTEKLVIQFRHVGEGLTTRDGESPLHFEIAGPAKEFVSATARIISKNQVEVSSRLVANPEFVRYAWKPFPSPTVNLTNSDDNPASPFTTEGL